VGLRRNERAGLFRVDFLLRGRSLSLLRRVMLLLCGLFVKKYFNFITCPLLLLDVGGSVIHRLIMKTSVASFPFGAVYNRRPLAYLRRCRLLLHDSSERRRTRLDHTHLHNDLCIVVLAFVGIAPPRTYPPYCFWQLRFAHRVHALHFRSGRRRRCFFCCRCTVPRRRRPLRTVCP